jgi:hypothetical protein
MGLLALGVAGFVWAIAKEEANKAAIASEMDVNLIFIIFLVKKHLLGGY